METNKKYKIALLTSSRADYSIYLPLIQELLIDKTINLHIIAFGTHNSSDFGNTYQQIIKDGFKIAHKVKIANTSDSAQAISNSMGQTISAFSKIWSKENYKLIICLGDRYEMFAAVSSAVPFNIPIAHISGGEVTLGAIDNVFRNALTEMASLHFASTEKYKQRIVEMLGNKKNVYNVGALSYDNLKKLKLYSKEEFKAKFKIDLNLKSILITFHPETVSYQKNENYINELIAALSELKSYQLIITMPNADTMGNLIREKLQAFIKRTSNAVGVESFGTIGYLTCMKYCTMMLGNTSSGFVEASFFPKNVINLGNRQQGRILTPNIITVPINKRKIINKIRQISKLPTPKKVTIYGNGTAAKKIVNKIKKAL